ncbi:MAG: ATP synthase F1 subunit gamma [Bacteroidales bacterium]|nr:ATP synthase F1 subunit gamma [Bacteroidales bacterium]
MPTLKEIKGRIGSVQSTLKITSAMKLVSSAKLRKAQTAIANMRPYEEQLQRILATVQAASGTKTVVSVSERPKKEGSDTESAVSVSGKVIILALASNSSLCGGFNANAIGKVKALLEEYPEATVYSIGRKMADAMRKAGYPSPKDYSELSEHPSYSPAAELTEKLMEELEKGHIGKVFLVYNHFVTTAKQVPVVEQFLPITAASVSASPGLAASENYFSGRYPKSQFPDANANLTHGEADVILEPNAKELLEALVPKTLKLKLYAALLDSAAAEHAARTVAMQTATDNGEDLLDELTLQYNKGRQQKITSEILDLASGQQ